MNKKRTKNRGQKGVVQTDQKEGTKRAIRTGKNLAKKDRFNSLFFTPKGDKKKDSK